MARTPIKTPIDLPYFANGSAKMNKKYDGGGAIKEQTTSSMRKMRLSADQSSNRSHDVSQNILIENYERVIKL